MSNLLRNLFSKLKSTASFILYMYGYHRKMYKNVRNSTTITVVENYHGFKEYYPKLLKQEGLILLPNLHRETYSSRNIKNIIYYEPKYIVLHAIFNKLLLPKFEGVLTTQSKYSNALIQIFPIFAGDTVSYLTDLYHFPAIVLREVISTKARAIEFLTGVKLVNVRFTKFVTWAILAKFKLQEENGEGLIEYENSSRFDHIFQDDIYDDLGINSNDTAIKLMGRFSNKRVVIKTRPGFEPSKLAKLLPYPVIEGDLPLELYALTDTTIYCLSGSCQAWHTKTVNIYDSVVFTSDDAARMVLADTIAELVIYKRYDTLLTLGINVHLSGTRRENAIENESVK